jgi:hypothetical protein
VGIESSALIAILLARSSGASLKHTVTLGRTSLYLRPHELHRHFQMFGAAKEKGLSLSDVQTLCEGHYSEALLQTLGSETIDSIDASDYEQPTIVHDLNRPVSPELHERFTFLLDSGTMEHVFDFPTCVLSSMQMLQQGGHFVAITPTEGQSGHGFYQFSPELFYSLFSATNGFHDPRVWLTRIGPVPQKWYAVPNPASVNARVEIKTTAPSVLVVVAQKCQRTPASLQVAQSDYVRMWGTKPPQPWPDRSFLRVARRRAAAWIPAAVKRLRYDLEAHLDKARHRLKPDRAIVRPFDVLAELHNAPDRLPRENPRPAALWNESSRGNENNQ